MVAFNTLEDKEGLLVMGLVRWGVILPAVEIFAALHYFYYYVPRRARPAFWLLL